MNSTTQPRGSADTAYCDGCGGELSSSDHARCRARRAATDPPRYCVSCGRKLVVQVLPLGLTARCVRCGPVEGGQLTGQP